MPIAANEGVLESPRSPASIPPSGAGIEGCLAICETISGAASIGVADIEAAPEMAQTKSLKYYLEPTVAQAYPSMHMLEGNGLRDGNAMTYSNGESRFCRPLRWRGAGASWSPSNRPITLIKKLH